MIFAPPVTTGTARFDPSGRYRYRLTRVWDDRRPVVVWIMFNPSTAKACADDADECSTEVGLRCNPSPPPRRGAAQTRTPPH